VSAGQPIDLPAQVDAIIAALVPQALPRREDLDTLARHRDWLLGLEGEDRKSVV
jgi:hypothetical protein